jgi:small GTP-binding protein
MNGTIDYKETSIQHAIRDILDSVRQAGDLEQAGKLEQLLDKYESGKMYIAFCGHFSAGKSSLINRLCGTALLPSSPIPTSANIVSIESGEARAEVYGVEGSSPRTVPLEQLGEACRNGDDIRTVRIFYPLPFLGEQAAILDTPGIDSTDDAHMMSTESALHLADVVFYVMDYNHVQSEMNFGFTKRLKEWGKPLYLIVNQIDKHRELELPFNEYQESVRASFEGWHIQPDGILYTTLKQPEHPHNDWLVLQRLLELLMQSKTSLLEKSIRDSLRHLIDQHGKVLDESHSHEKASLYEELDTADLEAKQSRMAELERLEKELVDRPALLESRWKKDVQSLLDNANITPASTRDLAQHYLESRKPGFKAGWFAGAAKTAQEIENRLTVFQQDFADKVRVEIEFHLRDLVKRLLSEWREQLIAAGGSEPDSAEWQDQQLVAMDELLQAAEALHVEAAPEWLAAQVHSGAQFSGEYTLNYSKHIAAEAKAMYRRQALELAERALRLARAAADREAAAVQRERAELRSQLGALQRLQALEAEERAAVEALERRLAAVPAAPVALPEPAVVRAGLQPPAAPAPGAAGEAAAAAARASASASVGAAAAASAAATAAPAPVAAGGTASELARERRARMAAAAERLNAAAASASALPQLAAYARAMREKAARLRDSRFTIALFGAFSAGKSSFANALIGERVLPVSPNPTTAAINRIVPPAPEWPHGTAKVKMKSMEAVFEDVRFSLEVLGKSCADMASALKLIEGLSPSEVAPAGKPHYTFLKAVGQGWAYAESLLGSELRANLEEFQSFVADERKSCFVEHIELHYSSPLTDQGIVLVDTPGADSINARHTGVAFNYMKSADAILFVTYYNHAFSQADREFLLQLGRVKDSLEMDKMFFIVNAADLAASEEELRAVVGHVETNLVKHGIRKSRIYPISSLEALEGKQTGDETLVQSSGISSFEQQFIQFTFDELAELAVHSARKDMERALQVVRQWIEESEADEERRSQRKLELLQAKEKAVAYLEEAASIGTEEMSKELHELLYYVKQRLFYRFGELYNYVFNPSALRDEGAGMKNLLRTAASELSRLISMNLSQEVLATTLRAENWVRSAAERQTGEWTLRTERWLPGFHAQPGDLPPLVTPQVEEQIAPVSVEDRWLSGMFKSPKYFFEGEGKAQLRQALEEKYQAPVAAYLEQHEHRLLADYSAQWKICLDLIRERFKESVVEHVEGLTEALEQKNDPNMLRSKYEELRRFHESI